MHHQRNVLYIEMQQQGFEVSDVMLEPVGIRFQGNARLAHAHMIWHDATMVPRERRNEGPVQVAPCRITMQHHHRLALSLVHIVHIKSIHQIVVRRKRETAAEGLVLDANHIKTPIQGVQGRGDVCGGPGSVMPGPPRHPFAARLPEWPVGWRVPARRAGSSMQTSKRGANSRTEAMPLVSISSKMRWRRSCAIMRVSLVDFSSMLTR